MLLLSFVIYKEDDDDANAMLMLTIKVGRCELSALHNRHFDTYSNRKREEEAEPTHARAQVTMVERHRKGNKRKKKNEK